MIENQYTEFKREYKDDIKYAVLAFANTNGGTIYIGLEDDGHVLGIANIDDTMLRLTNMIRDSIRPDVTMFTHCTVETMEGQSIITLTVQRGTARPYYLQGKGIRPEGVYVRQGASSVPASETAILDMIRDTAGDCFEDARSLNQQLTFSYTEHYFNNRNVDLGESQMRRLKMIGADGTFSNLGMLLSDQCVPTIKLAVFEGSKKSIFRDRQELSGSLLAQLEDAYAYLDRFNKTHAVISGLYRIDKRDYPPEALREALLNAIIHRDYALAAPTLISIFDDRVEMVNVGGLMRGISYNDIMLGVSALRNQHLANIFYRLHLIEAYGTGMLKINECYAEHPVKPTIEISDHAFKITLPNINFASRQPHSQPEPNPNEDRTQQLLALLQNGRTIARKDVEAALGISQSSAINLLRQLVDQGILARIGNGRSSRYKRSDKNS